jgi:putative DNA primase/helicase
MSSKKSSSKKTESSSTKSRVKIHGEGRDEWARRYFKFSVDGSDNDIPPFPVEHFFRESTQLFAALANAGWNGFTKKARNELLARLEKRKPKTAVFKVATRIGWNSGAYVLADETIGQPKKWLETSFGDLDRAILGKYRAKGTLKEWQDEIAALCTGNSRLMFAVSLAFTGPILRLTSGPRAGGFQIWGDAETGKTTAAMVAGSVWGCHRGDGRREKGFAESWNSTSGKVEVTALAHNDGLLILNETKRAGANDRQRAEVVTSVAFGLAEMTEKERLTNQGSARSWRCYFLSTSNLSLGQLARQGKVAIDEADRGRMTDIPLPEHGHGIYEELHGFANGEVLSDDLQRRARKYYGTPIREFIRQLIRESEADPRESRNFLSTERKAYRKELTSTVEAEGLKPLSRASGRFATVFAAGSLASKYRIVPWNREEILTAILSCELDQLRQPDEYNDLAAPSVESLRIKLVRYLDDNRGQFMNLNKKRPRLGIDKLDAVLGYRTKVKGQRWYYLMADQLKAIIGSGASASALKQVLASEGLLDRTKDKFVVQRPIYTGGKGRDNYAWVHAIKAEILKKDQSDRRPD